MSEFRAIEGFPGYRVSSDGFVQTCKMRGGRKSGVLGDVWKDLVASTSGMGGYRMVTLYKDGKTYGRKIARLVLEAFVGPRPKNMEACHGRLGVTSDALSNLRWDTRIANMRNKELDGTLYHPIGADNGMSKLTEEIVREIRQLAKYGMRLTDIIKMLKLECSPACVSMVISGKVWAHVMK